MGDKITKSAIQIMNEMIDTRNKFHECLIQINKKFDIKNHIFVCDVHGEATELNNGYFVESQKYDTLEDAINNLNIFTQGIWITENQFSVGNIYQNLSDAKGDVIIDLETSKII